ncbi:helix-turn-helix transcriptional regulator [Corynebacterium belfantii]|uniref:helix-turn-helix transcriptional regulator n=1 Tax=Corynebacterium belfantii TaxID=2014537 RepID=UPI0018C8F232|nr:WYL domain-containing protein [Corynebacterium belfantii]MBG9259365.1 WYL domain-containing protein [Corynebacterium belfantii]MBG9266059.1 WYL domain-containing protein [Corynebacterium belfantii]MBG9298346.1 WYL domain-containing protein [Corynebacterium belfantii]MBG9308531.1 WYL domain-containing protein [Corynebacterium belfantii]
MGKDVALERIVNLTFAFLRAETQGRHYISADWVIKHVDGYAKNSAGQIRSNAAAHQLFKRDRAALDRAGVPIETIATGAQTLYRLRTEDYSLPEVTFTPEEATVLALAGQMGLGDELATFSRSGWTKIAASGVQRELTSTPRYTPVNDVNAIAARDFDAILAARTHRSAITFDYYETSTSSPQQRVMDPWSIVSERDRVYLVGYDHDRQAPRCFRITKVAGIRHIDSETDFVEPDASIDLQQLVKEQLRRGKLLVNAVIAAQPDKAQELTSRGEWQQDGTLLLRDVDRDWLVRTLARYAPHARALSPTDLITDVVSLLKQAAGAD